MKRTLTTASVIAIAAAAAISFTAFAHPGQSGTGMMGNAMMGGGHMGGGMKSGYGQMHQYNKILPADLNDLEGKLSLTGAQTPAWKAFVDAAKEAQDNINDHHESMDPKAMHEMNLEDRQSYMQGVWNSRSEDAKSLQAAKGKLFEVLNPEQQELVQANSAFASAPCGAGFKGKNHTRMMSAPGMKM